MGFQIQNLDVFGHDFTFSVSKHHPKYKTKLGALVSILCVVFSLFGFYIFTNNYLDTTSPRVTISNQMTNKYPKIKLKDENFGPVFNFLGNTGFLSAKNLSKYITPMAVKMEMKVDPVTQKPELTAVGSQKLVSCRSANLGQDDLQTTLEEAGFKQYYEADYIFCAENMADFDFWTVEGSGNYLPYSFISIFFYPCSLPNAGDCALLPDLVQYDIRFSMSYQDYLLDNKDNPIKRLFKFGKQTFSLNPSSFQVGQIDFKKIRVIDEDKDFSKPKLNKEFFSLGTTKTYSKFRDGSIHCTQKNLGEGKCMPFAQIVISSGSEIQTVSRLYNKLFSMISEFGGFGDLIFILVGFFYVFYNNFFMNKFVVKSFANKEGEDFDEMIMEKKVSKEKLEKIKKEYVEEKMNGLNLLKNSALIEGLTYSALDKDHASVLEIMPLLVKIAEEVDKKKSLLRQKTTNPVLAIENVLQKEPRNDIERMIKKSVENLMEEIGGNKVDILGEIERRRSGGLTEFSPMKLKNKVKPFLREVKKKGVLKRSEINNES